VADDRSDAGPSRPAELAGASDESISLGRGRSSARIAIAPRARSVLASVGDEAKRVFLNIENITGKGPPGTYKVYVNLPEGEEPDDRSDHLVGTVALFGLSEQSAGDSEHGGSGLTFVLEITALVQRLQDEGSWNESDVDVDFVPLRPVPEDTDVRVGRVSVYHA
jgi:tyrosinase